MIKFNFFVRRYFHLTLWLAIICISSTTTFAQYPQKLEFVDKVYDEYIKTVQLYPFANQVTSQLLSPAISLNSGVQLTLEFDELFNDAYDYNVKIIHCNADWQPSGLSALQYLREYNEFNISDMEYSFGTVTPYVHYRFKLPRTTISGNFLLVVYAADNEEDIILSRRFMVFEQKVNISDPYEIMNNAPYSLDKQQLQFTIRYSSVNLMNPMEYVTVNILQNQRWDNAKMNLKPTFIREAQHELEYRHFTDDNAFNAGNEFRNFDIRSLKYFGYHVKTVDFETKNIYAWVENDRPRAQLAYSIEQDKNGLFFIENLERKIPSIENDYAMVYFTLNSEAYNSDVFISGKFTDWRKDNSTKLIYNDSKQLYEGSFVLKQGHYDYQYVTDNINNEGLIEGNKRETNNQYEIFVYYHSPELRADVLIGYASFLFNLNR